MKSCNIHTLLAVGLGVGSVAGAQAQIATDIKAQDSASVSVRLIGPGSQKFANSTMSVPAILGSKHGMFTVKTGQPFSYDSVTANLQMPGVLPASVTAYGGFQTVNDPAGSIETIFQNWATSNLPPTPTTSLQFWQGEASFFAILGFQVSGPRSLVVRPLRLSGSAEATLTMQWNLGSQQVTKQYSRVFTSSTSAQFTIPLAATCEVTVTGVSDWDSYFKPPQIVGFPSAAIAGSAIEMQISQEPLFGPVLKSSQILPAANP